MFANKERKREREREKAAKREREAVAHLGDESTNRPWFAAGILESVRNETLESHKPSHGLRHHSPETPRMSGVKKNDTVTDMLSKEWDDMARERIKKRAPVQ
mgnify:CR=1 FL=1